MAGFVAVDDIIFFNNDHCQTLPTWADPSYSSTASTDPSTVTTEIPPSKRWDGTVGGCGPGFDSGISHNMIPERNVLAFFCLLYKRTQRSFTFFIKECGVLCFLLCSL